MLFRDCRILKSKLDEYIVAQDKSKRVFSTAVFQHYLRVQRLRELEIVKEREQVQRNADAMRDAGVPIGEPPFLREDTWRTSSERWD